MLLFRVVSEKSKDPLEKLMGDARQGRLKAGPYLAQFVNVIRGGYENPKLVFRISYIWPSRAGNRQMGFGDCAASSGDKRIAL